MDDGLRDPYATLGVSRDAEDVVVRAAYKALARRHHPDLGGDGARLAQVNHAYEVLSDPARRAEHDRRSAPQPTPAAPQPAPQYAAQPERPVQHEPHAPAPGGFRDLPLGSRIAAVLWMLMVFTGLGGAVVIGFHVGEFRTALPWIAVLFLVFGALGQGRGARAWASLALLGMGGAFALSALGGDMVQAAALMAPVPMVPVAQWALIIAALAGILQSWLREPALRGLELIGWVK